MATWSPREVQAAFAAVKSAFPFQGYMTEGKCKALEGLVPIIGESLGVEGVPRLLDIGSGPMDKTAIFEELGADTFAVDDLQDPWHRHGDNRERIRRFADTAGIEFHQQSSEDNSIPFADESFDVVTILAVIEHLHESPRGILNAAGQQLKAGGVLAVTMPNSVNLRKRLSVLMGRSNYPPVEQSYHAPSTYRGHVREYTLDETAYIVEETGFDIVEKTTLEGIAYDKLDGVPLKVFLLLRALVPTLSSIVCVVARKPPGWEPASFNEEGFREAYGQSLPSADG